MPEINELISIIKQNAQEILIPLFGKVQARQKADGSLVTQADLSMSKQVGDALSEKWPDIRFLSEEMSQQEQDMLINSKQELWILDPLDGTTNFANGIPFFAVSLGYINSGKLQLGIVYDPIRDECFTTQHEKASQLNARDIPIPSVPESLAETVAVIDFKRLGKDLRTRIIDEIPYTSQRSFGSGALDWCWLALGRGHIYLHGRQNVWDYIVGQAVLSGAHGTCCNLAGEDVFNGQLKPNSAVAAATPALFEQWCSWLQIKT